MILGAKLEFSIDLPDGRLDTIIGSVMKVIIELITKVVQMAVEQFATARLSTLMCDKCGQSGHLHWKTRHGEATMLETLFGRIFIRQLQVQCACGHKFFITRRILGIEARRHVSNTTERKLGLLGALTSFRVAAKVSALFGGVICRMRTWRAVQAVGKTISFNLDPDEKPAAEADGTGIPTVGVKKRGRELKVVVQRKHGGGVRIAGLGIGRYDSGWKAIFKPMLPVIRKYREFLMVTDGDASIFKALGSRVKVILQRCLFHIPHQLKHCLWQDKVKHKSDDWYNAMGQIHSICSAKFFEGDEANVHAAVGNRLDQLAALIIDCDNHGWKHCASYLRNAEPDLFSAVLRRFSGKTTSLVERVMRTVNLRVNVGKWSEAGVLNVNRIRLAHYYNGFEA